MKEAMIAAVDRGREEEGCLLEVINLRSMVMMVAEEMEFHKVGTFGWNGVERYGFVMVLLEVSIWIFLLENFLVWKVCCKEKNAIYERAQSSLQCLLR